MWKYLPAALLIAITVSCNRGDHFITDSDYRQKVGDQFLIQKSIAKNRSEQLFGVFDRQLTTAEEEALKFLYAYMPLSDLADYDGDFFLKNVRTSLAARDTFSWGKTVPEEIFRHFVLPVRINNENMDSSRQVFFGELKGRIGKMTMREAVLEVNHWCHEKVCYRGTDGRTSAPLATVKTAYGRCGEESTFTVAALRSVGIPARQCYTPRWAHCDDNHAWVEVWVDGVWHYIGACEPEPELDMAWFTAPAKRAMLVNTNVFGDYTGPEDVLVKDKRFTRINILSNYTKTRRITVKVTGEDKMPVDSAAVEFQLYNYAEFYPLLRTFTDSKGLASFQTGLGDLIVWAASNGVYNYRKVSVPETDTVLITLSKKAGTSFSDLFDLSPPPEQQIATRVNDSLIEANKQRINLEDQIRGGYEMTFADSVKASRLAITLNVNRDTLWHLLQQSRGNWREIVDFIAETPAEFRKSMFPLLYNISEKDLRDITPEALADHLTRSVAFDPLCEDVQVFNAFILNPRVDNEWIKPYKKFFQEKTEKTLIDKARKNPVELAGWVRSNIAPGNEANWGRAPLTPVGSFEIRMADDHSRDILFVAMCRSFGIPSRLEPGTKVPQFYKDGRWHDVLFENHKEAEVAKAELELKPDLQNDRKPEYYIHYTVEQFDNGFFRSLDYEGDPQVQKLPCKLRLSPGYYLLVTGNRVQGGMVMASLDFFDLKAGVQTSKVISLRKVRLALPEYGTISHGILGSIQGDGLILAWLDPGKEPTKHFLSDLRSQKALFEKWKGKIALIFQNEAEMKKFKTRESKTLPANISYLNQSSFPVKPSDIQIIRASSMELPAVLFVNKAGIINYHSEGYRIGIGDELARIMSLSGR